MIKRPLNSQFAEAVLEGRKVTTIREKAWPVGVPIILYHWTGAPYRSKHADVAVVEVVETLPIEIGRPMFGGIDFRPSKIEGRPLWSCEGFRDQDDMDSWFFRHLGSGETIARHLMRFQLIRKLSIN